MHFTYSNSVPAVIIGSMLALGIAAQLILNCRPGRAAVWGAVSWACIGFFVGVAGDGTLAILPAIFYAVVGAPLGAAVAGVGALAKSQQPPAKTKGDESSE